MGSDQDSTDRHTDHRVELIVQDPQVHLARPRYTHLRFGLACLAMVAALAVSQAMFHWWKPAILGDIRFSYGLLTVVGWLSTVRALRHDLFILHRATVDAQGLSLQWSHVPRLIGQRTPHESRIPWGDVVAGEWVENEHDVDRRQYLDLSFSQPLGEGRTQLRIPVCDQRLLGPCLRVMDLLPPHIDMPVWLKRELTSAPTPQQVAAAAAAPHPALDAPIL